MAAHRGSRSISRLSTSVPPSALSHEPTDALASALQAHVKRVTAPYKYPREIEFVDELPKTRSGKIRRVELRRLEEERAGEAV